MACFIVPMTEAVVTTAVTAICKQQVKKQEAVEHTTEETSLELPKKSGFASFTKKLSWLNGMLWGGSALLAFEHLWHGEVVPWFPFLTNAVDPTDRAEMLGEMATNGVAMAVLVTLVWGVLVAISMVLEKQAAKKKTEQPAKEG